MASVRGLQNASRLNCQRRRFEFLARLGFRPQRTSPPDGSPKIGVLQCRRISQTPRDLRRCQLRQVRLHARNGRPFSAAMPRPSSPTRNPLRSRSPSIGSPSSHPCVPSSSSVNACNEVFRSPSCKRNFFVHKSFWFRFVLKVFLSHLSFV